MPRDIDAELKALPELPRALVDEGYGPPTNRADYRDCYTAAASARFPATRIRGRWYVHPRDYSAIAAALNLRVARPAPRASARRRAPTLAA